MTVGAGQLVDRKVIDHPVVGFLRNKKIMEKRSVLDFYDYVCYNKIPKSVWIFLRNQTHFSPCTLCECVAIF